MNMLPFKGFISHGLYFSSNYCVWLFKWDHTPTEINSFSEVWLFEPDGKRICLISTQAAIPIFNTYHKFDNVIGAEITWEWKSKNELLLKVAAEQINLSLDLVLKDSMVFSIINRMLKTNFGKGFISKGKTETGKAFQNVPHQIRPVYKAQLVLNDKNLGSLVKPKKKISVGDGQVSEQPVISFCTHHLEE